MNEPNENKPFGFLRLVGVRSIRKAQKYLKDLRESTKQNGFGIGGVVSNIQGLVDLSKLVELGGDPNLFGQMDSNALYDTLFANDDDVLRGLVLIAAADSNDNNPHVFAIFQKILTRRFSLTKQSSPELLTKTWLAALKDARQKLLCEPKSLETREDFDERPEADISSLDSLDLNKLMAVLGSVSKAKKRTLGYSQKLFEMLSNSRDENKTILLISELEKITEATNRDELRQIVAKIVSDLSNSERLREAAYHALYRICDCPVQVWPLYRQVLGEFCFPNDIDWAFVRNNLNIDSN
ncbi:MAG: hypothetical protein ABL888_14030 [Pirellulaceae bacterium]